MTRQDAEIGGERPRRPSLRGRSRVADPRGAAARAARSFTRLPAAALFVVLMLGAWAATAQEVSVPVSVQVALVDKVVAYDKNFAARAGERARVLILTVRGDADSERMGRQLKSALGELDRLGGLPHEESVVEFKDAPSVASACRDQHVTVLYFTPGLAHELDAIGRALEGVSVLSVGSLGGYASKGAVIDFFAEGGKPRIAFNLAQARKQQVAFAPEVVRIMRVVE